MEATTREKPTVADLDRIASAGDIDSHPSALCRDVYYLVHRGFVAEHRGACDYLQVSASVPRAPTLCPVRVSAAVVTLRAPFLRVIAR